ncbi:serine/threonine protein kinase [Spizellomyces punctatus DAOM BR117]|uniref:non-specific serine/threonine protein kinase n=1 Tax=Spizellomyces punctatus (strain DAOM BR117) TaxID=645134 RepID=A0A0L0HIK0_SPIPD|nr:serine/threonine protein kinase [Spizellomyces punctatus DAOM BR117]KND00654.1 serine/threonine protein kinase [Spizellomyces punctatus DAOM BR117]|eukprot:XP_016608693.1 serine/threonine protein kinase [Spizellomyces punctatus DAOM BR117]
MASTASEVDAAADKLSQLGLGNSKGKETASEGRYVLENGNVDLVTTDRSTLIPAVDSQTSTNVILKRIPSSETANRELKILHRLQKANVPHVLTLLDSYVERETGNSVLVFPRLKRLETRNIDLVVVARYTRQLAEALNGIHSIKLAHTEISAATIMADDASSLVMISWSRAQFADTLAADPSNPITTSAEAAAAAARPPPSFTAPDIHAAGAILGQWLEPYLPGCSLNYLGSRLVRRSTTTYISRKLLDRLDAQRMGREAPWHVAVSHAADLLSKMLEPDEEIRITAEEMLKHPFVVADEQDFLGTDYEAYRKELALIGLRGASRISATAREPRIFMRG